MIIGNMKNATALSWVYVFVHMQAYDDREDRCSPGWFHSSAPEQHSCSVSVLPHSCNYLSSAGIWAVLQHLLPPSPLWLQPLPWLAYTRPGQLTHTAIYSSSLHTNFIVLKAYQWLCVDIKSVIQNLALTRWLLENKIYTVSHTDTLHFIATFPASW